MTQITKFPEANMDNEEKEKRLLQIEKRLDDIYVLIENENANLAISKKELEKAKLKINSLETDEPVLNWSKLISDKRVKILGALSATKKIVKYNGIPFVDVKLSKSNGKFSNEVNDPSNGVFETKYKSETGKDGMAKVEIYVKKRDIPDNVKIVTHLKEKVCVQFEEEIDKAKEQIRLYNAEKEYCNQAKNNLDKGMRTSVFLTRINRRNYSKKKTI